MGTTSSTKSTKAPTTSKASRATPSGAPLATPTFTTPAELNEAALRGIGLSPCEPGLIHDCNDGPAVLVRAIGAVGAGSPSRDLVALAAMISDLISLASEGESATDNHEQINLAAHVASTLAEAGNHLAHLESLARNELLVGLLKGRG
jgi:hypothetical protein